MNGNKKVVLHITFDQIHFDQIYPRFEEMNGYENIYLFRYYKSNYEIKYIKHTEKLTCVYSKQEWGRVIHDPKVDIIFFHSLRSWQAIDYIRPGVIVMWWCYGYEIYENVFRLPSLMRLKILKPKTYNYLLFRGGLRSKVKYVWIDQFPGLFQMLHKLYSFVLGSPEGKLKEMLSRIDYIFTPLEIELDELKKKNPFIKAKPFRLLLVKIENEPIVLHDKAGHVLLEHSANISNNHLDILAAMKEKRLSLAGRNVFIPLNYGNKRMANLIKEKACFKGADVHCLTGVLPIKEYKEMLEGCTHALFGMIRQSGIGNVYLCFRKGIKVFFF